MKISVLLSMCFLIIGCSSNEYVDNQKMIAVIDSMDISKTITEVETDSFGNILDTISIKYLKNDSENRVRYNESEYKTENLIISTKSYFKADRDLFYRETFNNEELELAFEAMSNKNGRVVHAIQTYGDQLEKDTTFMNYSRRFYLNGKKKVLLIEIFDKEIGQWNTKISYDKNEKPLQEVMTLNKDTMNYHVWEYSDSTLNRTIYTSYQFDTSKIISYFDAERKLVKEYDFDFTDGKFIISKETNHFYNESNDRIKSIGKSHKTNEVEYIEYLINK